MTYFWALCKENLIIYSFIFGIFSLHSVKLIHAVMWNSIVWICQKSFIDCLLDGHLGYRNVAMNNFFLSFVLMCTSHTDNSVSGQVKSTKAFLLVLGICPDVELVVITGHTFRAVEILAEDVSMVVVPLYTFTDCMKAQVTPRPHQYLVIPVTLNSPDWWVFCLVTYNWAFSFHFPYDLQWWIFCTCIHRLNIFFWKSPWSSFAWF